MCTILSREINMLITSGPIARIGPNHLLTDDPEVVRRILATRSHYTRGPWFDSIKIDPHIPNIVSERHTGRHNKLRHKMSAGVRIVPPLFLYYPVIVNNS